MFSRLGWVLALVLAAEQGRAQACCASSAASGPGRLTLHEDALVGIQAKLHAPFGSFDRGGSYARSPRGTSEIGFEQDVVGTIRVVSRGQLTLVVPFVETWRRTPWARDFGGGLGDVSIAARYDVFVAGQSRTIPGIALLAAAVLPTGTPPESAEHPLAADATGTGAAQGSVGLALEQSFGSVLASATGIVSKRSSRSVRGLRIETGMRATALAAVAYVLGTDAAIGAFGTYSAEGATALDGRPVPDSASYDVVLGLTGALALSDAWRAQGLLSATPWTDGFGRNAPAACTIALMGMRTWT